MFVRAVMRVAKEGALWIGCAMGVCRTHHIGNISANRLAFVELRVRGGEDVECSTRPDTWEAPNASFRVHEWLACSGAVDAKGIGARGFRRKQSWLRGTMRDVSCSRWRPDWPVRAPGTPHASSFMLTLRSTRMVK